MSLPASADWPQNLFGFIKITSQRWQWGLGATALSVAALTVVPIELQRRIINEALEAQDLVQLLWLAGFMLAAIIALQAGKFILGVYQNWISQSVIFATRHQLIDQFGAEYEDEGEGRAVAVISTETDQVGEFVGTGISDLVADGGKLVFAIGYMLYVEPMVTLVALVFFLPQIVALPFLQKVLNRLMRQRTDLLRDLSDEVSQQGAQDSAEQCEDVLGQIFTNRARSRALKFLIKSGVNLVNSLAPLSVLVFGGYLYVQGETTIGTIVAFMSGFERMSGPLRALVSYYRVASLRNEQYVKLRQWRQSIENGDKAQNTGS
ncbi:MAG: ABC transporter ATP-binding protein [Pseudomonadota bacterium]